MRPTYQTARQLLANHPVKTIRYLWAFRNGLAPPGLQNYGQFSTRPDLAVKRDRDRWPASNRWKKSTISTESWRSHFLIHKWRTRRSSTEGSKLEATKLGKLGVWKLIIIGFSVYIIGQYVTGSPSTTKIFDTPRFTPFTVVAREEVSPTAIILTLRPPGSALGALPAGQVAHSDPYIELWLRGTWSVEFKQPELQIARSYTPLPPDGSNVVDLRFLVRKEHRGEVSSYLHSLSVGSQIDLRGPHPEVDLAEGVREVVFLAGGTGIAPALQAAYTLLETRRLGPKSPRIHIFWANRRREDCEGGISSTETNTSNYWKSVIKSTKSGRSPNKLVLELQDLQRKYPAILTVDYLVDEEGKFLDQKKISHATKSGPEALSGSEQPSIGTKLLLLSGPEGFINHFAGSKKWVGGKEIQGELGGVLGQMDLRDWTVHKL